MITADNPGGNPLVTSGEGSTRDRTSQVRWSLEPASLATIEPGGYSLGTGLLQWPSGTGMEMVSSTP
jgi:hypothetical protein